MSRRQAGAKKPEMATEIVEAEPSFDETNTPALGLCSLDDLRHFLCNREENRDSWETIYGLNWAKRYEKSDLEIVLRLHFKRSGKVRDLVFIAVPVMGKDSACRVELARIDGSVDALQSDFRQEPVFAAITKTVEHPDGTPLASVIRLERSKEREDIRWKIFTAASAYHVRFESRGGIGDREIRGFRFPYAREECRFISEIIERGPHMLDCLDDEKIEFGRCMPHEAAFESLCKSVRIRLSKENIWPTIEKSATIPFDHIELLFCAPDPDFSAQKRFRHYASAPNVTRHHLG